MLHINTTQVFAQRTRHSASSCPFGRQQVVPRLDVTVRQSPKLRVVKDEERPGPGAPQDLESLAKDALKQLNSDEMTVASVLGANYERLGQTIGEDKLRQISSILDPILKNRRTLTIVSAVVDVALIIAGIKLFQAGTSPHQ